MRQAVMGPLGKVGTHDRPLEIRGQKYVSNVNSRGQTPQLHPRPVPAGDTGTGAGQGQKVSGPSRTRPTLPHELA